MRSVLSLVPSRVFVCSGIVFCGIILCVSDEPLNGQENGSSYSTSLAPLFNGTDLSGWHGDNPHVTAKSPVEDRETAIANQQKDFLAHWRVEDGELVNDGKGPYATTDADYGDIEFHIDYKTVAKADSGIYLRGTPQIQIWDTTKEGGKWERDANFGSGGLFNNTKGSPGQLPLRLADKPFGEWNHFKIVQIGSRTWVEMNHQVVVDGAIMENYWDKTRKTPLPASGPIHLQTHGGEIRWKNLLVREIGADEAISRLRGDDSRHGFTSVFNGKNLAGWTGAVDDYEVKDGAITCKPGKGGVLFTEEQYDNFVVRLEFKLPPGGNNGLAIRYPGKGRASYDGMCELQVLDDDAEKYAKLDPRQYHGSVYGMAAAHRGYLRPAGSWNYQEVTVDGSRIKVELNGTIIVDADVSKIHEFKDDTPHPGKDLLRGHFGFAGHNDPVMFRNISIKRLPPPNRYESVDSVDGLTQFEASFDDVTDANLSSGDGWIHTAESTARKEAKVGNHIKSVSIVEDQGVRGDALKFTAKTKQVVFYPGNEVGYVKKNWSGSVSVWLKLDPDKDLEPGFCDPIQITERAWNDAAFFIDFDKELPRDFRLGVFPDLESWNPKKIDWNEFPVDQRPMVVVEDPPFAADRWTHVCFTWKNINSPDNEPAVAALYLDGELQGTIERPMTFTWQADKAALMLGLNYIGLMDELKVFSRPLNASQIKHLAQAKR